MAQQCNKQEFDLYKMLSFPQVQSTGKPPKQSWESDTTIPEKYQADFGNFKLDVIDTHGLADTRGVDQNKVIELIINRLKKECYVNCICLAFNGHKNHLTNVVREVITAIVSVYNQQFSITLLFVFSNTQDK